MAGRWKGKGREDGSCAKCCAASVAAGKSSGGLGAKAMVRAVSGQVCAAAAFGFNGRTVQALRVFYFGQDPCAVYALSHK